MLFTSIKDDLLKRFITFLFDPPVFSHTGEDDKAEMGNGKIAFWCPLSVWVAVHPAEKKREKG